MTNLRQIPQICTSFPNKNSKHIDYVITYKQIENKVVKNEKDEEKKRMRKVFLDHLTKTEKLEIKELKFTTGKEDHVYILIHCPVKRLMVEAEKVHLDMKLDKVRKCT